ncbi:DUF5694 domain-containing protein [Flindersiella endophytica]
MSEAKLRALLVGTYHFQSRPGGGGEDAEPASMKTPEKQAELDHVVELLAAYEPTKVMVQAPYAMAKQVITQYTLYRFGTYEPGQNEVHQVGYRLARRLGHDEIFPIDVLHRWWEPGIEEVTAKSPAAAELLDQIQQRLRTADRADDEDYDRTVAQRLAALNAGEQGTSGLEDYLTAWVRLVDGDNYAGADVVGNWYHRNLRIYANLLRSAQPGDRLLVFYGAAHIPVLRQLLSASGQFVLDDPLDYLAED